LEEFPVSFLKSEILRSNASLRALRPPNFKFFLPMTVLRNFNPDFAVGFVMKVESAIKTSITGYFLVAAILKYC
jgi:hypothetical protein